MRSKCDNSTSGLNSDLRFVLDDYDAQEVSHTPSGGLIPPTFAQHPPGFRGKGGREGKGMKGEREGRGEGKGRDPQGFVDTPVFQILKNTLTTLSYN